MKRNIYRFKCCTNGRKIKERDVSPHFFVVLQDQDKTDDEHITALPITSNQKTHWQVHQLVLEQIDSKDYRIDKKSYIILDRTCRVKKSEIDDLYSCCGKLSKKYYNSIIDEVSDTFKKSTIPW